jgi:Ubiquinol-cytochrome-c reductase complex subunit (QCR10)
MVRYRGMTLAGFGGVAGFFAVFFFSDIPRVRKDIVQKIPIIGPHYIREIPASDNVGGTSRLSNLQFVEVVE